MLPVDLLRCMEYGNTHTPREIKRFIDEYTIWHRQMKRPNDVLNKEVFDIIIQHLN